MQPAPIRFSTIPWSKISSMVDDCRSASNLKLPLIGFLYIQIHHFYVFSTYFLQRNCVNMHVYVEVLLLSLMTQDLKAVSPNPLEKWEPVHQVFGAFSILVGK